MLDFPFVPLILLAPAPCEGTVLNVQISNIQRPTTNIQFASAIIGYWILAVFPRPAAASARDETRIIRAKGFMSLLLS